MLLLVAGSWSSLPAEIPQHFGASGRPDATGARWTILVLPAVGVILYECLSGSRPTEASNVGQVLKALAHLRFPPIEQVAPSVPAGVTRQADADVPRQAIL